MKRRGGSYVEILILVLAFAAVMSILTAAFSRSIERSRKAAALTDAVILAQNVDAAASASDDLDELSTALGLSDDNSSVSGDTLEASFGDDMLPASDGEYRVTVVWTDTASAHSTMAETEISVYASGDEPVYTLTDEHVVGGGR